MEEFDIAVIGSGPAGYTGAIRAAQLGMKVVCIDKRETAGGTCLNEGCIPSKVLLNMSHKYDELSKLSEFGIEVSAKFDLKKMQDRKSKIVSDLCNGIAGLFTKNKITNIKGWAKILNSNTIEVKFDNDVKTIKTKNILIATGSEVAKINGIDVDEEKIVTSIGALSLKEIPENLIVIGAGYIGLELGSVYKKLGSNVTVIEYGNSIVPSLDKEIGKKFQQILEKEGMQFKLGCKVLSADKKNSKLSVQIEDINSSKIETLDSNVLLLAVGRKPYTQNLGLENVGLKLDEQFRIKVNNSFQTEIPNIYAVGDVIEGPMLAHKAEDEAIAAIEIIAGQYGHVNYDIIPSVIYTTPEVASVGKTEEQLKQENIKYKVGKFPFLANSRAKSICSTDGMVKIIADQETDKILGAHIIGQDAGTLIAEIAIAMEFGASSEDVARTCHAHPTLNESIKEAALNISKRSINI